MSAVIVVYLIGVAVGMVAVCILIAPRSRPSHLPRRRTETRHV